MLHPAGELSLTGLSQTVTFYKTAMDRIGVKAELVRIGAYKGAMEPFVMTEQSPDVRANKTRLLDDVFERMVTTIALDRARIGKRVDVADVRKLVDRGLFTPTQAQAAGLVDGVANQGQLEQLIASALGRSAVGILDLESAPVAPGAWPGRRVAVVLVDGNIVDGPSQELPFGIGGVAGSDTLLVGAGGVPHRFDRGRGRPARQQPGRLRVRVRRHRAPDRPGARGGQAGDRVDGRHGRVGRLLHGRARRRHLRVAVHGDGIDRHLRGQGERRAAGQHASASTSRPTGAAPTPTTCRPTGRGARRR